MTSKFSTYDVLNPSGVVRVLKDIWLWCDNGKPEKAIMYDTYYPQCNANKAISETFSESILKEFPNAKLIHIERAFIPYDTSEQY